MSTSLLRCAALLLIAGSLIASHPIALIAAEKARPADEKSPQKKRERLQKRKAAKVEAKPAAPCPFCQAKGDEASEPFAVCVPQTPGETQIWRALTDPTVIEFVETPLADVVDYLKDYHKIEIQLDKKALDDAGIGSDVPLNRNLRGITLRSALTLLLREFDLTWFISNEVLTITTVDVAKERREICVYNVAGLTQGGPVDELAALVWRTIVAAQSGKKEISEKPMPGGEGGAAGTPFGAMGGAGMGMTRGFTNAEGLAVIPYRQLLIVRHSPKQHDEIQQFLQQMHKALHVKE